MGTNRGTIAVMDANDGRCVHEIFFPGGPRKQVEIKHLALSSENEVRLVRCCPGNIICTYMVILVYSELPLYNIYSHSATA